MSEYLTIGQLAARLGVSRWTLYSWVGSGVLPHFRLGRQLPLEQTGLSTPSGRGAHEMSWRATASSDVGHGQRCSSPRTTVTPGD